MQTIEDEAAAKPAPATQHKQMNWRQRREWLHRQLQQQAPTGLGADELEAHFGSMPEHYWDRVNESDLVWGLNTIHDFLNLLAKSTRPATAPVVNWRQQTEANRTHVMLCTWDRHGLLAKAAAAFSTVRLDILQADVFTRADNIVLDLFQVIDADSRGVASPARLQEMAFLLEGALSEPPRFASVWACSRHKYLAQPDRFPPKIEFDNQTSEASTLVEVEASDRLGLLHDILQTLADNGLNITQARIETDDVRAHDTIYVKDGQGQKVVNPEQLEALRRTLEIALTVPH